jgi:predicted phosphohydrolase
MRLAWISDPHVNFVSDWTWFEQILDQKPHAILITGDIAESASILGALHKIADKTTRNVYFVLGNHDFYRSSIASVRTKVIDFCATRPSLHYLHDISHVRLTDKTAILGVDGWYDGRAGDFDNSYVVLNDLLVIDDFRKLSASGDKAAILKKMKQLTDDSAKLLRKRIERTIDARLQRLIIGTHVPPFPGASWHEGQVSDSDHLPFFSNVAVGREILAATEHFREKLGGKVDVYCGHTHGEGVIYPAEGLVVHTGAAEYYNPKLCGIIEYE